MIADNLFDVAVPLQLTAELLALGSVDAMCLIKALGIQEKHITRLELSIDCKEIIELKITRYVTKGEMATLAAELENNPPTPKEEK